MSTPDLAAIKHGWLILQQGRSYIKQKFPFFMPVTLGLMPRHVPGIQTLYVTSSMVLGVDMEWFAGLECEVAAGCLIHEDMHVMRDLSRMEGFADQKLAGYAFDMPINADLRKFKIKLPPWVVYPETFNLPTGHSGEKYYSLLLEKKKKNQLELPKEFTIGAGKCGGCDGITLDFPSSGDVGRPPADVRYFRNSGIAAIKEYISAHPGTEPGSLSEVLQETGREEVVVPWQQLAYSNLNRCVGRIRAGQSDYSLRRLAKRSYAVGFPRPGLISPDPNIVIIEDTSGSMGIEDQIAENRVELANMLRQLGIQEVWFFCADVAVQTEPRKITIQQLKTFPVVGRGGTDFRPAIARALQIRPHPNLIVYSTDGCGAAPPRKPPNTEFIWLLAPGPWTASPCDWGVQILTTNDPGQRKKYKILQ